MKPSLPLILLAAAPVAFAPHLGAATFGDDLALLKKHTEVIVLQDGAARVAVVPAWQGRVATSSAAGDDGYSFGWINRELVESGKPLPHINAFGGEDRFWLGPEGGQFSIFFAPGAKFEFADWFTPAAIDTLPFEIAGRSAASVTFRAHFSLTNYSGTKFEVKVDRTVRLLDAAAVWRELGVPAADGLSLVAFETDNRLTNAGPDSWKKETGLLSIWILGMYNPSPAINVVVPIRSGPEAALGVKVTSDYFGSIPPDRLLVRDDAVFFSGDGKFRSKIGINPRRSKATLGSYDAEHGVLTIVKFTQPAGVTDYVNSLWKLQPDPYGGDAENSYNDGPASPGAKPLGPFYELESSSPAAALAPGASLAHVHRTFHLRGPKAELDRVARAVLGVSLDEIANAFAKK